MTAPPPLPPGREMDAAVAVVLGWHDFTGEQPVDIPGAHFGMRPGRYRTEEQKRLLLGREPIPAWSTDISTIPELLSWLREQGGTSIDLLTHRDAGWSWSAELGRGADGIVAHGDTLPEALARLVIALAARRAT